MTNVFEDLGQIRLNEINTPSSMESVILLHNTSLRSQIHSGLEEVTSSYLLKSFRYHNVSLRNKLSLLFDLTRSRTHVYP